MNRLLPALLVCGLGGLSTAYADVSYLKCDVQVTFRKPTFHDTEWTHIENSYTKYLRVDAAAKMIAVYDDRKDVYKPICSAKNKACVVDWKDDAVHLDGTKGVDDPVPPHIDFRRSLTLTDHSRKIHLVIADYGDDTGTKPNMTWSYDGTCGAGTQPKPRMGPGAGAVEPKPKNPNYQVATSAAMPISDAERDQALAGYLGNTMWGFSGGGHWFHMWFFDHGLAYTSDDEDFSSETAPRQWYVGKDSTGYRMCGKPIPKEGLSGCYPIPAHKVGDAWVQHDMDGDAQFSLLPGRE